LCIVSSVVLAKADAAPAEAFASQDIPGLRIGVAKAPGGKCARCWVVSEELGTDPEHPEICPRCTRVLRESGTPC
jgi:isoleucyl-tRNA synthetase